MNGIFHRVSVRKFEQKPVEQEKIIQILRAGMKSILLTTRDVHDCELLKE